MIDAILAKLNLKSIDDLTPEERTTYRQWQVILAKPDTTLEDLKALLPKELERANIELRKHENSKEKDAFYKAYSTLCDFILKAVTGPQKERDALRAFLKQKYNLD